MRTRIKIFWIKLTNWEYWPWQIVYIPVYAYWLYCGIKSRAIFWFSAGNPGFEYGGILGASKNEILSKLPPQYIPITLKVESKTSLMEAETMMQNNNLLFPVVLKPDIGERGFHVQLIENRHELKEYLHSLQEVHLIQEYLDMPIELGVFYYRLPNEANGKVTSVVKKGLLKVIGDGQSTIEQLMKQDMRSIQQVNRLRNEGRIDLNEVLRENEEKLLEPIGNHVRGTAFLNAADLINDELNRVFDKLAIEIEGFYYGRFDIRCQSIADLYKGNFKVMEVNGAASEPAHIYSPNYPIFKGYKELLHHWRMLYKISRINHRNGVQYMSFGTGMAALKKSRFSRA